MSTLLEEARTIIRQLSPDEKNDIIRELAPEPREVGPGVWKTPGVCGGSACLGKTRIAVWMLYEAKQLGFSDEGLLESYPSLTSADLTNAWKYAENHLIEITTEIDENEAA